MSSVLSVMIIIFLTLLFLGVPIFIVMAGVAMVGVLFGTNLDLFIVSKAAIDGLDSFVLLAVPGFILAGELMNVSGITEKLVNFSDCIVGRFRGGLAYVNILTSMIMAGMSGAAISDASATSSVLVPAMVKRGFPKAFSVAITAASCTIGPIIPPSGMFILYGAITGISVGRLFAAGFIPGVLMGIFEAFVCYIIANKRNFPVGEKASFKKTLRSTQNSFFALLMPFIIVGGLVFGVFTPTEAAAIAVFLTVIIGGLVYRNLNLTKISQALKYASILSGSILILVGVANSLGWIIAYLQVSKFLTAWITSISQNKIVILLLINLFLLFLGCLMDIMAIMLIVTPIIMPIIYSLGIDPVHFGVVYVLNLMIGLITPPIGLVMFVTTSIAGIKMKEYIREIWPFIIILIILLFIITIVPELSLWLPNLVF